MTTELTREQVIDETIKRINEQDTIKLRYYNDGCYCAVGHLLSVCGVTDEELKSLDSQGIDGLYGSNTRELRNKIYGILDKFNISRHDLRVVQNENDCGTTEAVIKELLFIKNKQ